MKMFLSSILVIILVSLSLNASELKGMRHDTTSRNSQSRTTKKANESKPKKVKKVKNIEPIKKRTRNYEMPIPPSE